MKRTLFFALAAAAVLFPRLSDGRNPVSSLAEHLAASRGVFNYAYTADDGKVKMSGEGEIVLQDDSYMMSGDGLQIWCDGNLIWMADTAAKEVMIQSFAGGDAAASNPALLVGRLDRDFEWSDTGTKAVFNGRNVSAYGLVSSSDPGIRDAVLYFSPDGKSLEGFYAEFAGGLSVTVSVSSFRFEEKGDASDFVPGEFGREWIVTDLR